jgi:hypothetical protein
MRLSVDPTSPFFHRDALLTDVYVDGVRADNAVEADDDPRLSFVAYNMPSYASDMPAGAAMRNVRWGAHIEFRPRDERTGPDFSFIY